MGKSIRPQPGVCWWCGSPADSREHKYKRSDLVREFGGPPYYGDETLVLIGGVREREARGPGSDAFQFSATLCKRCNNERSQPFDCAYDRFAAFLSANRKAILRRRAVDLREIYAGAWHAEGANLARYFAKHIACRLAGNAAEHGTGIDEELVAFIDGGTFPDSLQLDPCIDAGLVAMDRLLSADAAAAQAPDYGFLGVGPLLVMKNQRTGAATTPRASWRYRWFTLYWQVDPESPPVNPFNDPHITLRTTDDAVPRSDRWRFTVRALLYRVPWLGPLLAKRSQDNASGS
jgi:hypothetical protein